MVSAAPFVAASLVARGAIDADNDVQGIAVHIASRVSVLAGPGEVLVSRTVKDLGRRVGSALQRARQTFTQGAPGTNGPLRGFELRAD